MTDWRSWIYWITEAEAREMDARSGMAEAGVRWRSVMRISDGAVWCAPLGTPDPWPDDEADQWIDNSPDQESTS